VFKLTAVSFDAQPGGLFHDEMCNLTKNCRIINVLWHTTSLKYEVLSKSS
jgi:hypothetical protein